MKRQTNLLQRGIIIVAIPILCQAIFLTHLAVVLICDIRANVERSAKSYLLIKEAYRCFRDTGETIVTTGLTVTLGKEAPREVAWQNLDRLKKQADTLAAKIESKPYQKENAELLRLNSDKWYKLMGSSIPKDGSKWRLKTQPKLRREIESYTPHYLDVLTKIIQVEEANNKADENATEKSIHSLIYIIALYMFTPIVVALIMARYFSVSITNPLRHLTTNGEHLARRETLAPVMNDAVEFVRVDNLLHQVFDEVQQAQTKEKDVIENAIDMICSIDRDQTFRDTNPYVERILGYKPGEIVGNHLSAFVEGPLLIDAIDKLSDTMKTGTLSTFDLPMRRADGSFAETKWSCVWSPLHEMFFCIVTDVTEQKRAEQLRLDFSDAISNDLRSPLVSIQASLNKLLEGGHGSLAPGVCATLTRTAKNVDRLVLLANELLDFQKIKGGRMQIEPAMCSLDQIAKEAVDCVSVLAEPKNVQLKLPEENVSIKCDRMKILQTIVNLLSNAIKFSPKDSAIEIAILESAQEVELSVKDQGPGIPAEYQTRIFEAFEQVPSAQAKVGTGLGLAICKLIAEAHGGSIYVTSEQGRGSTFTIKLPKA